MNVSRFAFVVSRSALQGVWLRRFAQLKTKNAKRETFFREIN